MIKVLYVDDEPDLLELGRLFLESFTEIQVETASYAQEALRMLKEDQYDAIISDYQMPIMGGITLLKRIRAEGNKIPFILFTGRGREEVVIEALNSGADFYVQKGGDPRAQFKELEHKVREAVRRSRAEEALLESEERFRGIFNHANDAIHVHEFTKIGDPGRFIDINEVACSMLGYTREELLQMSPLDISTGYHDPPLEEILDSQRTRGWAKFETEHRRKDGTIVPVEINSHVLKQHGRWITTAVVRDITENKRAVNALKIANKKLNLLSSITRHDLNNQMMGLTGYLALLEQRRSDPLSDEYLKKAVATAERISATVQFTKAYEDIGVQAPNWQDISSLVATCSIEISLHGVRVLNDITAGLEVYADPLIKKVFYNLIDNAVRYGGTITTIHFSIEERDGKDAVICADDGIGVMADMKERLFTRGFGKSHGLGLFLSREILAITGITLTEEGELGDGARFVMTIPQGGLRGSRS